MGNGLLTFVDKKVQMDDFFNNKEIIFYHNKFDLSDKISFYKENPDSAKKIAHNGQKKYFKLFNEIEVAKYIVNESFSTKSSPIWQKYLK